ncbi:MAG: translation elongation factor Ts [Fimbriimonas sp.]
MATSAADVKRLRDETDAPMMECKAALDEAGGDYARAKEILREKGKAAAGKKAGRATGAGVVAFSANADRTVVGAVVVECETDFVSGNEGYVEMAQAVADWVRDNEPGVVSENAHLKALSDEIVAKFRENVQVAQAYRITSDSPIAFYTHHNKAKGALVLSEGEGAGSEAVRKVAVQIVSLPPEVTTKGELSQEALDAELAIETKRAIDEGKPEAIAKNIAQGRINKEFIKRVVLLEQPFYADPSKSVEQYLAETSKGTKVTGFRYLHVGQV